MRPKFGSEYLLKELDRIGRKVKTPVTLFLIGGGALSLMGLKEATKDIDAIAKHGRDMQDFAEALSDLGYGAVTELGEEYLKLETQLIYENKDGCRFDIFLKRVVGLLFLSEAMEKRATETLVFSNLRLKLASKEDVFLFKSITSRKADLEDMNMLIQAGLNFDAILEEISVQKELTRRELWIPLIKEKLDKLNERYGIVVPIKKRIDELTGEIYKKLELLRLLYHERSMTLSQLERKSPLEGNEIRWLLQDLIRLKIVKKRGEKLELTTTAY